MTRRVMIAGFSLLLGALTLTGYASEVHLVSKGIEVSDDYCETAADADGFYRAPCVPVTYPGDTAVWRQRSMFTSSFRTCTTI